MKTFHSKLLKTAEDHWTIRFVDNLVHGYTVDMDLLPSVQRTFPFQGGSLFRGYAFSNQEAYDDFMKKTYHGNAIKGGGVWFKNRDDAARYAQGSLPNSAPLDQDEDWQGSFRGAIVEIVVDDAQSGIDLDLVNAAREDSEPYTRSANEVWLKTDLYELRTERRAGGEQVTQDNADKVLIKMIQKPDSDLQDILFVIHNIQNLSDQARSKAFRYLYRKPKFNIHFRPSAGGVLNAEINVYYDLDEKGMNLYKYYDVWLPKDQERLLREMRTEIRRCDKEISDLLKKNDLDIATTRLYVDYISRWVFHMAGEGMGSLRRTLGGRYHSLGEEGRAINNLRGEEQRRALEEHTKKIVGLIENLCRTAPEKPSQK